MKQISDVIYWFILILLGSYILYQKGYIFKNYQDITVIDAYNKLQIDSNITLIDVRTKEEIKTDGKIHGSILVPVQILERNIDKLLQYKKTKIFVYCRSGNRSITASRILANHNFHPYNVLGGINAWKKANLTINLQ